MIPALGTEETPSFTVKLDSDRLATLDPTQFRHIDYGYTVTSYSSQSLTTRGTVSNLDTGVNPHLINERMAYVVESRGTHEAEVYTTNMEDLEKYFCQDVSKTSALDGINALNWTSTPSTSNNRHTNQLTHTTGPIPSAGRSARLPSPTPAIETPALQIRQHRTHDASAAKPIAHVRNDGCGGCNFYQGDQPAIREFIALCKDLCQTSGMNITFEQEDNFPDWLALQRPMGTTWAAFVTNWNRDFPAIEPSDTPQSAT